MAQDTTGAGPGESDAEARRGRLDDSHWLVRYAAGTTLWVRLLLTTSAVIAAIGVVWGVVSGGFGILDGDHRDAAAEAVSRPPKVGKWSGSGVEPRSAELRELGGFLTARPSEVVRLDASFTVASDAFFEEADGTRALDLWEECVDLPKGEEPSVQHCIATRFRVLNDGRPGAAEAMRYERGDYVLAGYFAVVGSYTNSGVTAIALRPVPPEEALQIG